MDLTQIVKQAQEMQKKLSDAQNKYLGKEFQGISGGGKISILIERVKIGSYKVTKANIDLDLIRTEEKDIVEDLIVAAFNNAMKKADEEIADVASEIAGMVPLPPGLKFPF
ncbi:YbaB/EbfC family nucleoid-associated protein [Wolbachia endosymbiont of Howardula sp.]|uniref:YbaB/EbfC family nucleoid-associated protein n=1 Tax=Wolbachia endosymbiont of Howardula sp. TaxID=2916816 RepID=UPI00217D5E5F|nr:YbaB/EbfC family nucleoid-associated protein [Wolbachia endosymbiont of Howardula sp.]UWI83333.1 YbaB/EbfC family nucleoid-associated protein [Wolbachia endosymbiont of Howardula sp.]